MARGIIRTAAPTVVALLFPALAGRDASAQGPGVTLYRHRDRTGPWQAFDRDVPELSRTSIGARRASSVGVGPGRVTTLYGEAYHRGRSTTFREADNDLSNTPVGEDTASSVRVSCR